MTLPDVLLQEYLADFPWQAEFRERWPVQGEMRVRLALANRLPPAHVSSSILSIVLSRAGEVLFLHPAQSNGNISHVLIGGRPEPNETPEQTAVREVGEETGWRIEPIRQIGFRHFHQLDPRADQTDRPYPDFIQPIYAAKAIERETNLIISDDEIPAAMLPFDVAQRLIDPAHHFLLLAAAAVTGG